MSPGGSSSNGSRSPNALSQGRALSPIKDINQQYPSSEQNHDFHKIRKHDSSPKMRESTERNQFKPINSEHLITSNDKKSKQTLQEKDSVLPDPSFSTYIHKETIKKCEENRSSPKNLNIIQSNDNNRGKRSRLNLNESEASEDISSYNEGEGKSRDEFATGSKVSILFSS